MDIHVHKIHKRSFKEFLECLLTYFFCLRIATMYTAISHPQIEWLSIRAAEKMCFYEPLKCGCFSSRAE